MEIKHTTDQFKRKVKERKPAIFFFQDILEVAKKSISFGFFFFLLFSEIYGIRTKVTYLLYLLLFCSNVCSKKKKKKDLVDNN